MKIGEGFLYAHFYRRKDIIIIFLVAILLAAPTRIVMILTRGTGLELSAAGHSNLLCDGFSGFELGHIFGDELRGMSHE